MRKKHQPGCPCCECDITAAFSWVEDSPPDFTAQFTDLSTSNSGTINAWLWTFGDGNTSTEQNPRYTFGGLGPHAVSLTVTDSAGCQDTAWQSVTFPPTGCPAAPEYFLANITGALENPDGSRNACFLGGAPEKFLCQGFGDPLYATHDYLQINGAWEIPYRGPEGDFNYWEDDFPYLDYWNGSGECSTPEQRYARLYVNIETICSGLTGPNTFDITARLCLEEISPQCNVGTESIANAWRKVITLAPGQDFRDYGPIAMDWNSPNFAGFPYMGATYGMDPNCTGPNIGDPIAHPDLVLTPNG